MRIIRSDQKDIFLLSPLASMIVLQYIPVVIHKPQESQL